MFLLPSPGFPASHGTSTDTVANVGLDVCFSGAGTSNDVPNISLYIGADSGSGGTSTRTDNSQKEFRIASPHFHNEVLPVIFAMAENLDTESRLHIGGSTGSCVSPTVINFKVNSSNTVTSSSNDPQLVLRGVNAAFSRLELKNAGFSESCQGTYSTQGSGTMTFDCSKSTTF